MLYNLFENRDFVSVFAVALLAEGVDRNQKQLAKNGGLTASPSSRRAWIEIPPAQFPGPCHSPSPSSRRAWIEIPFSRTLRRVSGSPSSRRAWIEIACNAAGFPAAFPSPSSRRAWIEICFSQGLHDTFAAVALLAEGVDRNIYTPGEKTGMVRSPSSRRAWIEIPCPSSSPRQCLVALLAEGVDRNQQADAELKQKITSPSSRRAWIEIGRCAECR